MKKGQSSSLIIGLIVLVVLLVGFIAFQNFSKSSVTGNVVYEGNNEENTAQNKQNCEYVSVPYTDKICETKTFRYDFKWVPWDGKESGKPTISPTIEITNLENEAGIFRLDFALYDDDYFPNDYRKEGYREDVGWDEANIYTHAEKFSLTPYEKKQVTITVERKNINSEYWGKQRITPPTYEDCETITKYKQEYQCN